MRKTLSRLGPDLTALIAFSAVWMALIVIYGGRIHLVEGSIILPAILASLFVAATATTHALALIRGRKPASPLGARIVRILRDWLPLIFLVMVYETLRDYTGVIRPDYIDDTLMRLDEALFGVQPVLWAQRFEHPALTDYFALMYGTYIGPIMVIAALLYRKGLRTEFMEVVMQGVLCLYIGFFGYTLFPAGPPRFHTELPFDPQVLTGLFGIYEATTNTMDASSFVIHRASFPSLHAALVVLGVFQAWRYGGLLWRRGPAVAVTSWICVSVLAATVYLRHHWTVDLIAGAALAALAFFTGLWVMRLWRKHVDEHDYVMRPRHASGHHHPIGAQRSRSPEKSNT